MAIGKFSDFVVRDELFNAAFIETLNVNIDVFNAGSANTLRLVSDRQLGHFTKTRFFDKPASGYTRRDISDTSSNLTPDKLTQDELAEVKVNRRFGPYSHTIDSFRKIGMDSGDFSMILGEEYAERRVQKMVEDAIAVAVAVIRNESTMTYDYAATGSNATADVLALSRARELFGDQFGKIRAWANNSGFYFSLIEDQITAAGGGSGSVGDVILRGGEPATLGLPMVVSDQSDFSTSGTPGEYHALGLVPNAVVITATEMPVVATDQQLLKENLELIVQGEDAYNVGVKGFAWDTSAGNNPSDADLTTAGNWVQKVANLKDGPGVAVDVDQS